MVSVTISMVRRNAWRVASGIRLHPMHSQDFDSKNFEMIILPDVHQPLGSPRRTSTVWLLDCNDYSH